jgi:hypothetical protein
MDPGEDQSTAANIIRPKYVALRQKIQPVAAKTATTTVCFCMLYIHSGGLERSKNFLSLKYTAAVLKPSATAT